MAVTSSKVNSVQFFPRAYDQSKVVRRDFTEFGKTAESGSGPALSVDRFFQDYEALYFDIPASGSVNSHEYLVSRSMQLAKPSEVNDIVQPLLDEITTLRAQAVEDKQVIAQLQSQLSEKVGIVDKITEDQHLISQLQEQLTKVVQEINL